MTAPRPILVGAVAYDPKVVTIWEIIKAYFEDHGTPMDFVFYSNYGLLVTALLDGDLDIAWNSPLAWVDAVRRTGGTCRAIAMRDTDRDRVSHIVVRADGDVRTLADVRGRTIAVGAADSPQATLIPLGLLADNGLVPDEDVAVLRHDVLVGKHGDHVGGERDALDALLAGDADACAMLDLNHAGWTADGTLDPATTRILATTPPFDHCVFTVRADFNAAAERDWLATLFTMDYANPDHREMMDLEGLKAWLPGRTSGFGPLTEAVGRFGFFEGRRVGAPAEPTSLRDAAR
ncbi:MAG: phosphate/phosphite/phosphonate ABC transporter substrate-binding protein [Ardenticatenales bacterium]|nr:phosphate/phosphite/phosphonate ABC transporter substrate-binding protein [Ardenticatenales bacterium]